MPLYDCMFLFKRTLSKEAIVDLVSRVGKHVYRRNGVLADVKSLGEVQLGYEIKKLDGRYYQGKLMQMKMMMPPSLNTELHYLNKEDQLLRWLLVKHRNVKSEYSVLDADDAICGLRRVKSNLFDEESSDDDDDEHEVSEHSHLFDG